MAVCVIGDTFDTDTYELAPACSVHCHWAPCPLNGEPASPGPMETFPHPSRDAALSYWQLRTKGLRSLILHGDVHRDGLEHEGRDCWCAPEFFAAVEL